MTIPFFILMAYGILLILGGFIGYVVAGSIISLIAGFVSGVAVQAGTLFSRTGIERAPYMTIVVVLAMLFFFAYRYWTTMALMPAGMMLLLTIVALIASFFLLQQPK